MPTPAPSTRPLWQKLGCRSGETLHLVGCPADVDRATLAADPATPEAHALTDGLPGRALGAHDVVLAFAASRAELATLADRLRPVLDGSDVRVWIAYPKGGRADFNRDQGWEPIGALALEGVSQIALDACWSALRFRPRAYTTRRVGGQAADSALR
jgi:hypothetical protein